MTKNLRSAHSQHALIHCAVWETPEGLKIAIFWNWSFKEGHSLNIKQRCAILGLSGVFVIRMEG